MGQVLTKYNAKSPKQSSNRLNFIAKTINLVHLGIAIIYGWTVLYSVQCTVLSMLQYSTPVLQSSMAPAPDIPIFCGLGSDGRK